MAISTLPNTLHDGENMEKEMLEREFSWLLFVALRDEIKAQGGGYPELHRLLNKDGTATTTLLEIAKLAVK